MTIVQKQTFDIDQIPMKLKDLKPGMMIGMFKLLKRVRSPEKCCNMTKVKWRVTCTGCNNDYTVPGNYMIRRPNPKLDCGCQKTVTLRTKYNREYRIWYMIIVRTTDPRHVAYENYGGRGIKLFPEWLKFDDGFEKFFAHVGPAPTNKHSIDRIDNNKGYEPGNLKWSTAKEQAQNTQAKQRIREAKAAQAQTQAQK